MTYGCMPLDEGTTRIAKVDLAKKNFKNENALSLFDIFPSLAPKEYAVILDKNYSEAQIILDKLYQQGLLDKKTIKTSSLYSRK